MHLLWPANEHVVLHAEGLVFREWTYEDIPDMVKLFDTDEMNRWTPLASPYDESAARRYVDGAHRQRVVDGTLQLARRAGVQRDAPTKTAAATAAAKLTLDQRKAAMTDRVLDEAGLVLDQLFAKTTERKIVNRGEDGFQVASVTRPQPTFAEQRHIVWSAAVLIDKAVKLSGGDRLNVSFTGEPDQEVEAVAAEVVSLAWARQERQTG